MIQLSLTCCFLAIEMGLRVYRPDDAIRLFSLAPGTTLTLQPVNETCKRESVLRIAGMLDLSPFEVETAVQITLPDVRHLAWIAPEPDRFASTRDLSRVRIAGLPESGYVPRCVHDRNDGLVPLLSHSTLGTCNASAPVPLEDANCWRFANSTLATADLVVRQQRVDCLTNETMHRSWNASLHVHMPTLHSLAVVVVASEITPGVEPVSVLDVQRLAHDVLYAHVAFQAAADDVPLAPSAGSGLAGVLGESREGQEVHVLVRLDCAQLDCACESLDCQPKPVLVFAHVLVSVQLRAPLAQSSSLILYKAFGLAEGEAPPARFTDIDAPAVGSLPAELVVHGARKCLAVEARPVAQLVASANTTEPFCNLSVACKDGVAASFAPGGAGAPACGPAPAGASFSLPHVTLRGGAHARSLLAFLCLLGFL